ncbi:MAG: hypothetical protein AAB402_01175 [Patescibacteria group bacterium]
MNKPVVAQPIAPAPQGKKAEHNYLIPVVVAFLAIAAFLLVLNFAI